MMTIVAVARIVPSNMNVVREVASVFMSNPQVEEDIYSLGISVDLIKASDILLGDRVVAKLPNYNWRNEHMPEHDHWIQNLYSFTPESIMWCDCHKWRPIYNRIRNSVSIFKDEVTNEIIKDEMILSRAGHRFKHECWDEDTKMQGMCATLLEIEDLSTQADENFPYKRKWIRPNKKHMLMYYFENHEGDREDIWLYPDDVILRITEQEWEKRDRQKVIDTSINWEEMSIFNDELSYERFMQERQEVWTWHPENTKECVLGCSDEDILDSIPDIEHLINESLPFLQMYYEGLVKRSSYYFNIMHNLDLSDYLLADIEFAQEILDTVPRAVREILGDNMRDRDVRDTIPTYKKEIFKDMKKNGFIKHLNEIPSTDTILKYYDFIQQQYIKTKQLGLADNKVEWFLNNWFENPVSMPKFEEICKEYERIIN